MKPGLYHRLIDDAAGVERESTIKAGSSPANDAASQQAKYDWLRAAVTQEMFETISTEIEKLESRARQLAMTYHTQPNPHEIVGLLIQSSMLRQQIEKYGR